MQRLFDHIWKKYGILGMCFAISIGAHVMGLVVFGSYKLFQYIYPRDANFEAVPFRKKAVLLRTIQHKVLLKKPQNARVIRRLAVNKLAQVNLPIMPNKDVLNRKFEVSKNFLDGGNIFGDYDVAESVFGSAKRLDNSFEGKIYSLDTGTPHLPKSWPGKSLGSIFTRQINVPTQGFEVGFPGVSDRFEWFGIEYTAKFYVSASGDFEWKLLSDDGAILYIDTVVVIDNDGIHPPGFKQGKRRISEGVHKIRVKYFQGPRTQVALQLMVRPPGASEFALFNLSNFPIPANEME